jgi:sugar (pentulose or hexulose) kinase
MTPQGDALPDLLVGIDVGATGIKAGLFDLQGRLVARATRRNCAPLAGR